MDAFIGSNRGGHQLFRNDGSFHFTGFPLLASAIAITSVALGDLDGDGFNDILGSPPC